MRAGKSAERQRRPAAAGSVTAGLCAAAFVLLTVTVARSPSVDAFDQTLHSWVAERRQPWLTTVALWVTSSGTSTVVGVVVALVALATARGSWARRIAAAVAAPAILMAGVGVRLWLSDVIARPRPPVTDWAGYASGYAYPSGHTAASALAAGLLLWLLSTTGHRLRRVFSAVAIVWALGVGATRVYLGVHWPTDVLAGWLFAAAWVTTWVAISAAARSPRWTWSGPPLRPSTEVTNPVASDGKESSSTRSSGER